MNNRYKTKRQLIDELEKLRKIEERNRRLLDTMNEGVVLIDPKGTIIQANPAAERILGLTRSQIQNRNYDSPDWKILRPDLTPMPPEEMAGPRAMKEKRMIKDVVMGVKRPDSGISWITVSAAPLIGPKKELQGIVGTFTDITKLIQAEEDQKKLLERLQESLAKVISGFIPICSKCRKIRDENREWQSIEDYIINHSNANFTHSLCQGCFEALYPDLSNPE